MENKPNNSIDFEPVSVEEAAQVESPAILLQNLDAKFETPIPELPKSEDTMRVEKLTETLSKPPEQIATPVAMNTPEKKEVVSPITPNESDVAHNELLQKYPNIQGKNYGEAETIIKSTSTSSSFGAMEAVTLPVIVAGMGYILVNASLVPGFISTLATGSTGVVTGTGILAASTFGVLPIVAGASYLAYSGYKLYKNIKEGRRLKGDQETLKKVYGV